jgi:diguanylate cyclase (GGDEF)-like protein
VVATRCSAGDSFALMLVNLDRFEEIFAGHGTNIADPLLFEVSARIREKLSHRDIVMRSGESQFAVLALNVADPERAESLARSLIERLEDPMTVSGIRFRLSATIGITLFPKHCRDWKSALRSADTAAFDARKEGRGRISVSFPAVR